MSELMSLWRNGYRVRLLIGRLRVRVPPETHSVDRLTRLLTATTKKNTYFVYTKVARKSKIDL